MAGALALMFVVYGAAGVADGATDGMACYWLALMFVVGGAAHVAGWCSCGCAVGGAANQLAGVLDGVACWRSCAGVADGACCKLAHSTN